VIDTCNWWDETSHWDVPGRLCLWHLILALAKVVCQGDHAISAVDLLQSDPPTMGSSVTLGVTA
jgi:hypothetical protein